MSESRVGRHKVVYLTYEIRDLAGNILEKSDIPVGYVHGASGTLFEKIEERLAGCTVGQTVEVQLSPEDGFGPHKAELTFTDELQNVPPQYRHLGAEATFANDAGETVTMVVTRIEDGKLTLDGNHPFAGKAVEFRVTVAGVRDATEDEISSGAPAEAAGVLH